MVNRNLPAWKEAFLADESGQATTEYILMLAMMVTLALMVINRLIRPIIQQLGETLFAQIQARLTRNFHRFPVRQ